jgi:hypothetical protein
VGRAGSRALGLSALRHHSTRAGTVARRRTRAGCGNGVRLRPGRRYPKRGGPGSRGPAPCAARPRS